MNKPQAQFVTSILGLQVIMLEKAGQLSKSPKAYKSRFLHVVSFLISLVRWLYSAYTNRYFPYHQKICRQWWSLSLSDKTGLETLLIRQSKLSPHCKTNSEDQNKLLSDEECLICLNDNLHDPVNTRWSAYDIPFCRIRYSEVYQPVLGKNAVRLVYPSHSDWNLSPLSSALKDLKLGRYTAIRSVILVIFIKTVLYRLVSLCIQRGKDHEKSD